MKKYGLLLAMCGMLLVNGCGAKEAEGPEREPAGTGRETTAQGTEDPAENGTETAAPEEQEAKDLAEAETEGTEDSGEYSERYEIDDDSLLLVMKRTEDGVEITAYGEVKDGERATAMFITLDLLFEELESLHRYGILIYMDDLSLTYIMDPDLPIVIGKNRDGSTVEDIPDWMKATPDAVDEESRAYMSSIISSVYDFIETAGEEFGIQDAGAVSGADEYYMQVEYEVDGRPLSIEMSLPENKTRLTASGSAESTEKAGLMFITLYSKFKELEDLDEYTIEVSTDEVYVNLTCDGDGLHVIGENTDGSPTIELPDWITPDIDMSEEDATAYITEVLLALQEFASDLDE